MITPDDSRTVSRDLIPQILDARDEPRHYQCGR
jgi:hypothetical protein